MCNRRRNHERPRSQAMKDGLGRRTTGGSALGGGARGFVRAGSSCGSASIGGGGTSSKNCTCAHVRLFTPPRLFTPLVSAEVSLLVDWTAVDCSCYLVCACSINGAGATSRTRSHANTVPASNKKPKYQNTPRLQMKAFNTTVAVGALMLRLDTIWNREWLRCPLLHA